MIKIKKDRYLQLNYQDIKMAFKRYIYNGLPNSINILTDDHKRYYTNELNELYNTMDSMFLIIESFGSGKDAFPYILYKILKQQSDPSFFLWDFKHNNLKYFAGLNIYQNSRNKYNECIEFNYIFDLSLLCTKIIIAFLPNIKRDILFLNKKQKKNFLSVQGKLYQV